jgi:hypothetical protein
MVGGADTPKDGTPAPAAGIQGFAIMQFFAGKSE